jgi:hypothetical protein
MIAVAIAQQQPRRGRQMCAIHLIRLFVVFIGATALYAASPVWSQQKYTFESHGGAKGQLMQQHYIEVGDVPRHFVGIDEIHHEQKDLKDLSFAGVLVKEIYVREVGDFANGSGHFYNYIEYRLEDGNKVFSRSSGTVQADGGRFRSTIVEVFTGGTGKFKGIRGQLLGSAQRDAGAASLEVQTNGEYWIEE